MTAHERGERLAKYGRFWHEGYRDGYANLQPAWNPHDRSFPFGAYFEGYELGQRERLRHIREHGRTFR